MQVGIPELVILIAIAMFGGFWIWMLSHCACNPTLNFKMKSLWIVTIMFLSVIDAFLYFLLENTKRHSSGFVVQKVRCLSYDPICSAAIRH